MREKLNSNPYAQVGLIGVLIAIAVFFFIGKSGGGSSEASEESSSTAATVTVAGTGASGTAEAATPGEAVEGAVEGALESGSESAAPVLPPASQAPPLPKPVTVAYKEDKTVVLLVVHDGSIDDRLIQRSVPRLRSLSDVEVFVVPASQVARYSAITLAVEVERVPALIVVRPRNLDGKSPQASVTYGYQSPQAMEQEVRDGNYDGPETTYHPG